MATNPFKGLGACWWDFDENLNVVIECTNPPAHQHYLLRFLTPKKRTTPVMDLRVRKKVVVQQYGHKAKGQTLVPDCSRQVEMAERMVVWLNQQQGLKAT